MEKLANSLQLAKWNLRSLFRIPQKTMAPIIWRPPLMTSSHHPSPEFLQNLTSSESRKVQEILEEIEILSRLSTRFPKKLKNSDWKTLLELKSRKSRMDHMEFRFRKERMAAEDARKDAERRTRKVLPKGPKDRFLLDFQSFESEKWLKYRNLIGSFRLQNTPILAVDCQFLQNLSPRGRGLTALQLQYLAMRNRDYPEPFRLFFVNYDKENEKIRELEKDKLKFAQDSGVFSPICTNQGLRETFGPSSEIIYLSPDASEELETVENDKIYVIGGIVDRVVEHGIPRKASLEAAEKEGVSARKLPIDRYISFKSGSRFLTLLAVSDILRHVNLHGDWQKALETVIPVRNTRSVEEKNQKGLEVRKRIHEFNREILRRIDEKLGKERFPSSKTSEL